MTARICSNCRSYKVDTGECRAHPPQVTLIPVQGLDPSKVLLKPTSAFPPVQPTWYCDEFADKKHYDMSDVPSSMASSTDG